MATPAQLQPAALVAYALAQLAALAHVFSLYNSGSDLGLTAEVSGAWTHDGGGQVSWGGTAPEITNDGASAVSVNAVSIVTGSGATPSQENVFYIEHATQSLDPGDKIVYDPITVNFNN